MEPTTLMRCSYLTVLSIFLGISWSDAAEPKIELIPEARLGHRGHVKVKEVEWKVTHPKMGQSVTVCKVIPEDLAYQKVLIPLAESYGMTRRMKWDGNMYGSPADGTVRYQKGGLEVMQLNPATGYKFFSLRMADQIKRNADGEPILKGMPNQEEAAKISMGWLKKLGIGEESLARDPQGPAGYYVQFGGTTERGSNKKLGTDVTSQISMRVIFPSVIGGIPAFWNGKGGCYIVKLADGGEFARADWCVRASEPIGEFELLSRDDLTKAIQEGFCWVEAPLKEDKVEVTKVQLLAYHGRDTDTQKHFPPLWMMATQPVGKPEEAVWLYIPALKQHRDKYDPIGKKRADAESL